MIAQNLADGGTSLAPQPTPVKSVAGTLTATPVTSPTAPTVPTTQQPTTPSTAAASPTVSPVPVSSAVPVAPPAPIPQAQGVSLSPINASNDLRSQLITPGAATDRNALAAQQLATYNTATNPVYQQALREATSQAAGAGQLGSGQLRTSLGDLAENRLNDLDTQNQNFLTNAQQGSISDAYNNLGIAQQQQARQDSAQNTAFGQGVTSTELGDNLLNSSTNRGLATLNAGDTGNPSDTDLILSQLFGGQAAQGSSALTGLIGNTVANNNQQSSTDAINAILQRLGLGSSTATGTIPGGTVAPDNIPLGAVG